MDRNPYVHIGCGSRVSVVPDGIPADEQVLNLVSVEQLQKLFEVGW
jgi:hypothetical protein